MKTILDIKFLKKCKQEQFIPTFANVRLSTKRSNIKLKHRIALIITEVIVTEVTIQTPTQENVEK